MSKKLFGTDGVRGQANQYPMTSEIALKLGMAAGKMFTNGSHRHRVVIGKDTRLSGYMIESALISGFTSVGMDVFQLGPVPTPGVAMLTRSMRADLGVMISASHNSFADNGIKIFGPDGYKLCDAQEAEITEMIEGDISSLLAEPRQIGRAKRIESSRDRYIEAAKRSLPRNMRFENLRIVIDCAHGAAYKVAPLALWELGAEVITIGVEPNGTNINEGCGSTSPEALCEKVKEMRADIGIALDGDADRVVVVDEKGQLVDGDQLMAVIAKSWNDQGKLQAGGVVATVMSNLGFERFLENEKLKLIRTPVGDRYVVEHMRQHGFNVGGEQSGHIVLTDFSTTGDGLVSALQILAVVVSSGKPVSEVCSQFEPIPQLLQNVRFSSGTPLEEVSVIEAIKEGESRLGQKGRLVIRPSGTEPLIRVMAEGDDKGLVEDVVTDIVGVLKAV
ncbi:MAG: phosphoglucosamine mutase [Rhodomicrobiaceae bacterium]